MKGDFVYKEMEQLHADGVDFVPIGFDGKRLEHIYSSFTKEEWKLERLCPKTNRMYWKVNESGRKQYIKE